MSENVQKFTYKFFYNKDKWVVFLDSEQDLTLDKKRINLFDLHENYGYKIFTIDVENLTYEMGSERFKHWLKENNMI